MKALPKNLFAIIAIGFFIRLAFVLWGAELFWPERPIYLTGDSSGFITGAKSITSSGYYTIDSTNKNTDSRYGRLPGYPAFIWLNLKLAGPNNFHYSVVVSQVLLDTVSILLCYLIVFAITTHSFAAVLGAALYALYPFVIVWTVKISTETFATFLFLLVIYTALCTPVVGKKWWFTLVAAIVAVASLTREYFGILVMVSGFILFLRMNHNNMGWIRIANRMTLYAVVFLFLFGLWPLRNYLISGKIVWVVSIGSGYSRYQKDYNAFRDFVYSFQEGIEPIESQVVFDSIPNPFPDNVFINTSDKALAQVTIQNARKCGSSFVYRRTELSNTPILLGEENCDDIIVRDFIYLRQQYMTHNLWKGYVVVPMINLGKAVFKSKVMHAKAGALHYIISALFAMRTLLVIAGFCLGAVMLKRYPILLGLWLFAVFQYFLICWIFRQVEMRYLLQADVGLILIGVCLGSATRNLKANKIFDFFK